MHYFLMILFLRKYSTYKMRLNTFLAIVIVLLLILFTVVWILALWISVIFGDSSSNLKVFIPGALIVGFWSIVGYQLYKCTDPISSV